jgi:hypothetical protein
MTKLLSRCGCGAVTVEHDGQCYSMKEENLQSYFPELMDTAPDCEVGSCDYCINHWGVDLCACGSGLKYTDCPMGYRECGRPMQVIEDGVSRPSGGWQ